MKRIYCWLFGCSWSGTRYNHWFIATEERCSCCGKYRHHLFEDILPLGAWQTRWREGKHPLQDHVTPGADAMAYALQGEKLNLLTGQKE